jgi:hypothetical protein
MRYIQETSRHFDVPRLRKTANISNNKRKYLLSRSRSGRRFSENRIKKTSGSSGRMPIKRGNSRSSSAMSNRRSNCSRDMYSSSSGCRKDSHRRPKGSKSETSYEMRSTANVTNSGRARTSIKAAVNADSRFDPQYPGVRLQQVL